MNELLHSSVSIYAVHYAGSSLTGDCISHRSPIAWVQGVRIGDSLFALVVDTLLVSPSLFNLSKIIRKQLLRFVKRKTSEDSLLNLNHEAAQI